jgi:hypothetical protein
MAMSITLGTLVTRCRERANREGDGQLVDTEFKDLISEKYGELHALVSEKGARYFETEVTIDLSTLALPADHLSTLGVDMVISGSTGPRRPLEGPIAIQDRSHLIGLTTGGPAFFYGIEATTIPLYPAPSVGSATYKHLYLPQPTDYSTSADSTLVDVIDIYGRKFIIWGVTAIAQHKGSESQERALLEEQKAKDQLEYWACQRALTHAPRRPVARSVHGPHGIGSCDAGDWRWG